jgi:hypothetical protein
MAKILTLSRRGKIRLVMISGTDFSGQANTVKAKTLTETGSGNRVKAFSLVRAGRIGQVSRVKLG